MAGIRTPFGLPNWNAIVARDRAGRTPLDLIDRTELLQIEANQVIFESLKRCHKTYTEIQKGAREEKEALLRKQKAASIAVEKTHQQEMNVEHTKHARLLVDTEKLITEINSAMELTEDKDHELQKYILAENRYFETIRQLRAKEAEQQQELENQRAQIKVLKFKIEQKNGEIQRKNTKIDVLSKDLKSIVVSNETDVMESLMETERSMRTMVSTQIALQKLLSSKSKGLVTLLKQRGIAVPDVQERKLREENQEENSSYDEDAAAMQDAAASAAMMAAATVALQPKS